MASRATDANRAVTLPRRLDWCRGATIRAAMATPVDPCRQLSQALNPATAQALRTRGSSIVSPPSRSRAYSKAARVVISPRSTPSRNSVSRFASRIRKARAAGASLWGKLVSLVDGSKMGGPKCHEPRS